MAEKEAQELLRLPIGQRVHYDWSAGVFVGRFYKELKETGRIYANKCPNCGRFHLPPRPVCARCNVMMEEWGKWVEVGPKATVLNFVVAEQSFLYPTTGEMLKVPFTTAVMELDGAPALFTHYLEETNPDKLKVGMRVEAVFKPKEERKENIHDIVHFKAIEE